MGVCVGSSDGLELDSCPLEAPGLLSGSAHEEHGVSNRCAIGVVCCPYVVTWILTTSLVHMGLAANLDMLVKLDSNPAC